MQVTGGGEWFAVKIELIEWYIILASFLIISVIVESGFGSSFQIKISGVNKFAIAGYKLLLEVRGFVIAAIILKILGIY